MFWFFKRNKKVPTPAKKPIKGQSVVAGGAIVGVSAISMMAGVLLIDPWEGNKLVPYLDIGGVPTACGGVTGPKITKAFNDKVVFTEEQCRVMNGLAVEEHRQHVLRCLKVDVPEMTEISYISFTYNVGGGAFCRSTLLKKANEGDIEGSCNQLSRWVFVGGRQINGLANRRIHGDDERLSERTVCMIGINPDYKTPLFEELYAKVKFR